MTAKIPQVHVIGAITPSPDSVRAPTLSYAQLEDAVNYYSRHEYDRIDRFWSTETDTLDEQTAATQLALQYMLMGSLALNQSSRPQLWSERYTRAACELYGQPNSKLAKKLWLQEQNVFNKPKLPFRAAQIAVRAFLEQSYEPVLQSLMPDEPKLWLSPTEVAQSFERGLSALADQYNPTWNEWLVERHGSKDSVSTIPKLKKIVVGMRRSQMLAGQLPGVFAHEVLVHGLRGVNGAADSSMPADGLPGYLVAEEGVAVFYEYALSGEIPQKIIDRYVDIAYALGQIDGQQHSRHEMIDQCRARAIRRLQNSNSELLPEEIEKEVYAHVNRIYRGSNGDGAIGIMTKDISYYDGFLKIGIYLEKELKTGKTIEEIMHFILRGKFDPTNNLHIQRLQ